MNYFTKMKGHTHSPPRVGAAETAWSWVGSFLVIALLVNDLAPNRRYPEFWI